jgi:hypothetical protein
MRCFTLSTAFLFLMLFPGLLLAQYPNIQVSQSGSTDPEEVTISINPTNPLNLAAGANIDYYYYTFDGGYTWTEGQLSSTLGVWGDPSVTFDALGNLYYGHLSNPSSGYWLDRIVVQKSTDGGVTWNDGSWAGLNPPKEQDKEWLAADQTGSPYQNNIYMAWTEFDNYGSSAPGDSSRILFSRSIDSGSTWSSPVKVSDVEGICLDGDDTVEGAVPAVGPNGEVYVSWAGPLGIMFDKSTDGGVTFGTDIFVTSQPGGWDFDVPGIYRCNGLPVTACDISDSPYQGNVYVNWSDQRNGLDDTDVFFIKSTDGGATWGDVKRVNDDSTVAHQFFTWMTVDPATGIIWIAFYDRRNTIGNATDVYVAKSEDGGETFENFEVSESSFTPSLIVFFGDYINIAARDGKIYPIWMRMDSFKLSIWVALIDQNPADTIPPEPIDDLTVDLAGGDIHLWWSEPYDSVGVARYVVHRSTSAIISGDSLAGTTDTTYLDGGAAGASATNYFYQVKAVDEAGNRSELSNRVGEFDKELSSGKKLFVDR